MLVTHIWRNCGNFTDTITDMFFVGFSKDELDKLFPLEVYKPSDFSPINFCGNDTGNIGNKIYYLISRDLYYKQGFPWYYPISGQWNGNSPFEVISDKNDYGIEISSLNELEGLQNSEH
jgi:hypothetical protein